LITLSGRPADFLVGGELPYPSFELVGITGAATPAVDFKPFGTRLSFVPVVLGNGLIRLDVLPEIVQVTKEVVVISGVEIPVFNTQRLRATVEMESGQSLALGGLLQTEEESDVSKVPLLGDLPVAGALFREVEHSIDEFELLVLVTPHLVDPLRPNQKQPGIPGEETRPPTDCELYLKAMPETPVQPFPRPRPTGLPPGPIWEPATVPAEPPPGAGPPGPSGPPPLAPAGPEALPMPRPLPAGGVTAPRFSGGTPQSVICTEGVSHFRNQK
jgi:pilus assembly protein CpaC